MDRGKAMALMETHYYSSSLGSNITLNVFVPTPGGSEQIIQMGHSAKYDYENGLPVLYLCTERTATRIFLGALSNIDRCAGPGIVVHGIRGKFFYQDLGRGKKVQDLLYGGTAALHPQCISGGGDGRRRLSPVFPWEVTARGIWHCQTGAVREGGEKYVRRAGHCRILSGGGQGTTTTIRFIGRIALGIRTNLPGAIADLFTLSTGM